MTAAVQARENLSAGKVGAMADVLRTLDTTAGQALFPEIQEMHREVQLNKQAKENLDDLGRNTGGKNKQSIVLLGGFKMTTAEAAGMSNMAAQSVRNVRSAARRGKIPWLPLVEDKMTPNSAPKRTNLLEIGLVTRWFDDNTTAVSGDRTQTRRVVLTWHEMFNKFYADFPSLIRNLHFKVPNLYELAKTNPLNRF
jgi:hypothetical protein